MERTSPQAPSIESADFGGHRIGVRIRDPCWCAFLQVCFLFDFGTGAFGLLLADGLVYGCASVSNGIAEGWASRAAKEGTDFSNEARRQLRCSVG